MSKASDKDSFLGMKLVPLGGEEALCFVCTYDKPFLMSKVTGCFTIHDCHILEAHIHVRGGIVTDHYKIRIPDTLKPSQLEIRLFESIQKVLKGDTNIEKEIFEWEKNREVIQDQITPKFKSISNNRAVLSIITSNKKGLLHKISWALSLAGMSIQEANIAAKEDTLAEDVFWIKQRYGERITRRYQKKVLDLLKIIVNEGMDPIEQVFKKEINMIYRQQLTRRGSGLGTAQLYADAHLRLIEGLFNRIKEQLDLENKPLLIGVYGGIGSGAIGFTSDIDCIFLYDGERKEDYDKLKRIFRNEFERICDLDMDESFLSYHINYFYLGNYDGESIVSFKDFFSYVHYIDELRKKTDGRLLEPQFFHYPWAFSIRYIGHEGVLERFKNQTRKRFRRDKGKGYETIKAYILRERRDQVKGDYISYLKGRYFPQELGFLNTRRLKHLYRKRAYEEFIESILPYDAVKYIFRRGISPLLHILHHNRVRTDNGLLRKEYKHLRPAINFMLKAFNVRKTLFIKGTWDLKYFLYIMECKTPRTFCETYLRYQQDISSFVKELTH